LIYLPAPLNEKSAEILPFLPSGFPHFLGEDRCVKKKRQEKIGERQRERERERKGATMKRTAAAHSHGYFLNREGLIPTFLIFAFAAVPDVPFINTSQSTRSLERI